MSSFLRQTIFLAVLLFPATELLAQAPAILRGKVIDSKTLEALPGASVRLKGGKTGTLADATGNYQLNINQLPQTIVVSFIGYQPQELEITKDELNKVVKLEQQQSLSEVVVTAVGIKSATRSLGYSVGEVKGTALKESREPNIVAALSGKVSGVQINNSGGSPGGSSTIKIRGNSSLLGSNAPLFILDGIPVDNSIQDILPISNSVSLATPSNRAIDINSADIASVTVLKGPAAAALYGIRAANGAVVINTKRGSTLTDKSFGVTYSGSFTVDKINRRMQPRQYVYSNGIGGQYVKPGTTGSDENWGALLDTLTYSTQSSPFYKGGAITGKSDPSSNGVPVERFNNIDNFYVNGYTNDHNISFYGNTGNAGYYFSYGNLKQTGIIPTTDFYRQTFRFNGDYNVSNRLKLTGGVNYIKDGANNRALMGGFNTNVVRALMNSPANFDITNGYSDPWKHPESYKLPATSARPWGDSRSYANGIGWDNPYWSLNMNPQTDEVNRFITFAEANLDLTSWLKATARYGLDNYTDVRKGAFSRGTSGVSTGTINDVNYARRDNNLDVLLVADHRVNKDLQLTAVLGYNYYDSWRNQVNTRGDGLTIPGNFNISNAAATQTFNQTIRKKLVAGYADLKLDYKKYLYLELTGRNEWTSTLAKGKNAFFYPSVSTSFIFTDALHWRSNILNFGKIRATYAQVGNDADPYSLETYYVPTTTTGWIQSGISFPFNGKQGLSYSSTIGNPDLKPERISTWEAGLDLHFFRDRTQLEAVYYYNSSKDQIIPVTLPYSTGAAYTLTNAGNIINKGLELNLQQKIITGAKFNWTATALFNKNISKVNYITDNISSVSLGGIWMEARGQAGEPYGVFYGTDVKRNAAGKPVIDDNPSSANYGYPIVNSSFTKIGDPNPDFNVGLRNEFHYDAFTFSFLLDGRFGFDIFNAPRLQMVFNGVDESTIARGTKTVFDGVTASKGEPNKIEAVLSQAWYRNTFNIQGLYVEHDLYWLKLKDVNLTYALPARILKPAHISAASITLTARNFLLATNYTGSDPDLGSRNGLSNAAGIDFWTTPNTKSYGVALNVSF
ncbi:TonB-linked outer membrane protein, SusC/RagA family [Chitinophaga jiangningensis]|uniref:TonB-linked outer membrane protein, SusC/RagA family n=1 Tax=Chitinophaga jiangningensis TaxID=1419482 RepID=A0A1M7FYU4_9BACT|nr:SusC/RagA family TonB-linked outer membrane protein [Chitinophaga jiangningensis]SHM09156.1 TonB-linked outer membrane protein, SusC/RagA family [Chitinophaga jiangningensis]